MLRANLCLHTGARRVDRDQLAQAYTPLRTATWVPIPHDRLLRNVVYSLERSHMNIVAESHGLTPDGNRYFGLLQVAGDGGDNGTGIPGNPSDFGLVVGLRNSHDKRFPAGLVVGASVFVCDNLSFSGDIRLARKHTAHVERDLPELVDVAIGRLGSLRLKQEQRFLAYKGREISDAHAHDLIIRAMDAHVVPVTKLPEVIKEWREPRHPEFCEGRTAWRLFNAFTEALKGNLGELPRRSLAIHGLIDGACDLVMARPAAAATAAPATPDVVPQLTQGV